MAIEGAMPGDVPNEMTAIGIAAPGGPEALVPQRRPVPVPGPDEVLIKVVAAGVNRPDVMQRQGKYPPPPGASDIPGLEVAGTIVAAGGSAELLIGRRVCALLPGGGYAEYALAPAGQCLPVPEDYDLVEAAALPETLFTVWSNLFERAYVVEGDMVLVHGGTSGIGTMAISLCKLFDIGIIVTCGSDAKCEQARPGARITRSTIAARISSRKCSGSPAGRACRRFWTWSAGIICRGTSSAWRKMGDMCPSRR